MSRLKTENWSDTAVNWQEDDLQTAIVQMLRREDIEHAADQNLGRRSLRDGQKRIMTGMKAGEPDLRIYGEYPKYLMIELKRKNGTLSKAQQVRIPKLKGLGYPLRVVWADCPDDAVSQVRGILREAGILT